MRLSPLVFRLSLVVALFVAASVGAGWKWEGLLG